MYIDVTMNTFIRKLVAIQCYSLFAEWLSGKSVRIGFGRTMVQIHPRQFRFVVKQFASIMADNTPLGIVGPSIKLSRQLYSLLV